MSKVFRPGRPLRRGGTLLGFGPTEGFFLGSMLLVSSSAVISKVLAEYGVMHEKVGQLAPGMTVLEDVVAVVMLTQLSPFVHFGQAGAARLGETLGLLGAFVALAGIGGLLIVPRLLRKLSISAVRSPRPRGCGRKASETSTFRSAWCRISQIAGDARSPGWRCGRSPAARWSGSSARVT